MSVRVSSRWSDREEQIRTRLRSYRALVSKHAACVELYEQLFPRSTARLTDEPRGGDGSMCELDNIVQQRMDLSAIMARSLQDMRDEAESIMAMLKMLPATEYTVLLRRYMMCESWERIAEEMHYCRAQVINIHNKAIHIIEKE